MILLLGSNGYLGEYIVRDLETYGIVKFDVDSNINHITEDFLNDNKIRFILNFANISTPLNQISQTSLDTNLLLPYHLVTTCSASKAKPKLIHISTREVLGQTFLRHEVTFDNTRGVFQPHLLFNEKSIPLPQNLFGRVKLIAEQMVSTYKNGIVVRLATPYTPNLYQNRGGLVSRLGHRAKSEGRVKLSNAGRQLRDPLHVSDISDFIIRLMNSEEISHGLFNIGGGQENEFSLSEIVRIMNPNVEIELDDGGDFGFCFDNRKALSCLGWKPKMNLREVEWKIL